MAVSRTILRATALKGMSPDECLEYTNNLLCKESINSMFVTVFYGILNTGSGELKYANGGHNPPYRISTNGDVDVITKTGDMVLGIMDDLDYKIKTITIKPGDSLFLFTDGVTEAENESKHLFTEARLEMLLQENHTLTPRELCDTVLSEIHKFADTAEQSDDITLLSIKYYGK